MDQIAKRRDIVNQPMSNYELKEQQQQEHYEYLDGLRASGVTNMFGAAPYLEEEFGMDKQEARHVLKEWMAQFGKEKD